ncbi:Kievitone hydratase [Dissostichus eleginoides]|uniref:Kievitone hydratase n=1 Tax=Dissostichus eleginoides TaxID=100907 RepID=A0AAD9CII9_DISEL|nr:Kievitone hydratase [Dissostichus eleginoides]
MDVVSGAWFWAQAFIPENSFPGSSWSVKGLLRPIVAELCAGGAHRMEPSGGLVLGLEPVGRKSGAVVHCHSERPLRVHWAQYPVELRDLTPSSPLALPLTCSSEKCGLRLL